jgi:hypothetical protein
MPKKGARQTKLADRLHDAQTKWQRMKVRWYVNEVKEVEFLSDVSLWHTPGFDPVQIRWVLIRCPDNSFTPAAFFCSDPHSSPAQIVNWFIIRWNIEVTFQEMRTHLGFETQRQWSDTAMERTTPLLLGVFIDSGKFPTLSKRFRLSRHRHSHMLHREFLLKIDLMVKQTRLS